MVLLLYWFLCVLSWTGTVFKSWTNWWAVDYVKDVRSLHWQRAWVHWAAGSSVGRAGGSGRAQRHSRACLRGQVTQPCPRESTRGHRWKSAAKAVGEGWQQPQVGIGHGFWVRARRGEEMMRMIWSRRVSLGERQWAHSGVRTSCWGGKVSGRSLTRLDRKQG